MINQALLGLPPDQLIKEKFLRLAYPFILAYFLDLLLGDPPSWPHPVKIMGRISAFWEKVYYRPQVMAGAIFWVVVLATIATLLMLGVEIGRAHV